MRAVRRAELRQRLGALALTLALLAGVLLASLKGAWWTALIFTLAWVLLQVAPLAWRRIRGKA